MRPIRIPPTRRQSPAPFDVRKEEYLTLRKEIENNLAELASLEKTCLIGVATAYAWVATTAALTSDVYTIAWALPVIIPFFGALRCKAIGKHLGTIAGYLMTVEKKLFPLEENAVQDGWEHYFEKYGPRITADGRSIFWTTLIIASVLCSAIGVSQSSPAKRQETASSTKGQQATGSASTPLTPGAGKR